MWTLVRVSSNTAAALGLNQFRLPEDGVAHVVFGGGSKHPWVVRELQLPSLMRELGRIVVGPFGVKLEAIADTVTILPSQTHMHGPATARFQLQPQSNERSEAIFLRHGDVLEFPKSQSSLTCQWTDSEVQVNSSAAADSNGVAGLSEDETEDEDSKKPTTQAASPDQEQSRPQPQPRATPQLSNQRLVTIVQETPTTGRVERIPDSREADLNPPDITSDTDKPAENTPTLSQDLEPEQEPEQEAETFSTARTGESQDNVQRTLPSNPRASPQVQIPARFSKKRTLPIPEEEVMDSDNEALAGPTKRAKTSDSDTEDSRLSNVDVAKADLSMIPPRTHKSSQRSTSIIPEDYNGPAPRVACSNSTIAKTSQVLKFLKKQGGTYVESLADDFNVLSVRNGDLQKTTKVLYAIARGIPIVTDQWLYESASAKRLLAVSAYKPSAPKQEEEWKLKLDDILGQPQAPFAPDYNVHFTKSLKAKYASFSEIEAVGKAAGAKNVTTGPAKMKKAERNIVLADDGDDAEAQKLMKDGVTCYTKDFFTFSILRGVLDLESDEFKIEGVVAADTPLKELKKKRGRKST
ncbi:hypothetical protein G6011_03045 [Alternaria panax]|uniref:BRCT domain-containing protein n=1 Tax=Alternaria panax TaxID=48097 RepID=A0AAD4IE99_9PLEO|nr:hypothetical protein G6011_03045 [Alternaria panax]